MALDEQQRECCEICCEPISGEHVDIGGKWICLVCTKEIVGQVTVNAKRELTQFMNAVIDTAQRARNRMWRERMMRLSMN